MSELLDIAIVLGFFLGRDGTRDDPIPLVGETPRAFQSGSGADPGRRGRHLYRGAGLRGIEPGVNRHGAAGNQELNRVGFIFIDFVMQRIAHATGIAIAISVSDDAVAKDGIIPASLVSPRYSAATGVAQ